MAIKSETVEAFIAEAEKELSDILRRKAELEDLIKKCKALFREGHSQQPLPLKIPSYTQPTHMIEVRSLRRHRGKKIWEQIVDLLNEVGVGLSISEIVQGFKKRDWPLSAKNASKIIYRAMKDKSEIFINTGRGTWDLKERFQEGVT